MEEDSSRTISYQDASKSSREESKKPNPALPSPSRSPSADSLFTSSLPAPTNALGASRIPNYQDSSADSSGLGMNISVLQPPQVGGGKPMHFKRGPGRPRKDGAGKSPKTVVSHKTKKISGLYLPTGGRGIRGRKKADGAPFVGGTNSLTGSLGDLNVFNHESPPRFLNAEDTAESDTSSVASSFEKLNDDLSFFPEQWPGKFCALCNLGEKSMLGQGDLIRLEIPSGFDPHSVSKGLSVSSKNERDNCSDRSPKTNNFFARRQKGVKIKRLTSQGSLECMNEPVDEVVGYAEEPDLNNIFDFSTGFYYVHVQCALWCDDVVRDEDGNFENLEREIVRALSQHCSHCGNLGAGIACRAPSCGSCLHFACAATSGGFQDSSSRTTLCASHIELAVAMLGKGANCTVCDQPGNTSSLLMCCSCNNHYHSACLALNSDPTIRAGWQCPACKVCQACRQPGDDSKLLPCDACDKVYHIFCLRPALTSCPKYSWKCKMCRICTDCGARTPGSGPSSRWHANFTVCDSCYQQRNKGLACPLCGKAYRHVAQKHMVQCHHCKKYVHDTCDPAADLSAYHAKKEQNPEYEYTCGACSSAPSGGSGGSSNNNAHPRVLLSIKRSLDKDEASSESSSIINSFTLSQDSFLSPEDDSLPGTENSNDLTWADKISSIVSLDEIRPPIMSVGRGKPLTGNFPKKKLGVGRPRNTEKQVLNSANNRRQRMSELQRKRGPKPKIRGVFGAPGVGLQRPPVDIMIKCDEEPGVENRLVLCSSRDEFVLQQDVCVMCGAFGNDLEGRLISCSQCGQCYHPFCVNVRVTKVVLQKGWRCLDCTVCEGCGHRHDEARLILCDDCDISFHIYCMDPPLEYVPQGNWKCKWCVVCQSCGSNDPGPNSGWLNNYTLCGPCASLCTCPVCKNDYSDGELIIRCERCNRWLHSSCDMINNENEAEECADDDYQCVLCRPTGVLPPHLQPPPVASVKALTPPRSPELKSRPLQNFVVDGVNLSEVGMSYIKSLSIDQPRKKRKKISNIADMEAGILAAIESVVSGSSGDTRPEAMEADRLDEAADKDKESNKKKQRNLQKLGIGGFVVRLRGSRFKDEDELGENQNSQDGGSEKPRRKQARKKIKNKIVESFPPYLQEAFFGNHLMDPCKDSDFISGDELESSISPPISDDKYVKLSADELKAIEQTKARQEQNEKAKVGPPATKTDSVPPQADQKVPLKQHIKMEEDDDADDALQELIPLTSDLLDNELVDTIMNEGDDMKEGLDDLQGVDSSLGDDAELSLDHNGPDGAHKDELTDFLSSQFNLESGLPSMDSKDVEDIFKGVLTDESQESQDNLFPISTGPPPPPTHPSAASVQSGHPVAAQIVNQQANMNTHQVIPTPGVQGSPGLSNRSQLQQSVQQGLASPISFPPPSPYHSEYSNSPQFSPAFSEPPSPWPTQVDSEPEAPSNYSQRSILKWEVDEALGLSATISCVLYANTNHPELKRDFPNWAERSKQIAKIWRGLSTEKRAPFLQRARENRAASRIQKSQQIPKDSKGIVGGGGGSGGGGVSGGNKMSLQSPDTVELHMKMSPSSSSSCSASGSSSCDIMNMDSSGSSQLSSSTAVGTTGVPFPCTNISAALSSVVPVCMHSASPCLMSNNGSSSSSSNNNNNNGNNSNSFSANAAHSSQCKAPSAVVSNTSPAAVSSACNIVMNTNNNNSCSTSSAASVTSVAATSQKDGVGAAAALTPKVEMNVTSSRCSLGDQQIRVLTPSEIMRTLPTLSQESCSFSPLLDQDKIVNGPIAKPALRGETSEERHWKQMQAMRQQQQQQQQIVLQEHRLQGEPLKDRLGGGSGNMNISPTAKLQFPNAMAQVQRQIGSDGTVGANDMNRQPLQVTTSHDMGMPAPQSSPHLQSPNSRQMFGAGLQANRPRASAMEMPPPSPSPHYSPRPGGGMTNQPGHPPRPPMYSRVPYLHSPRAQTASPNDPYASSPMTPQPASSDPYAHPPNTPRPVSTDTDNFSVASEPYQKMMTEQYGNNSASGELEMTAGLSSPRPQQPQGQETRQHLRDLLQRQQIKKMEQDQMSPGRADLASPSTPRPVWSQDEWQKSGPVDQNFAPRHQLNNPNSPQIQQQQSQFRHPFLPPQGRIGGQTTAPLTSPNRALGQDFLRGPQSNVQQQPSHPLDPRFRLVLHQQQQQQQQQRLLAPQQQAGNRPQMNFSMGHQQQPLQAQLQQQQQQQQQQPQQQHQMNQQSQFRPGMSIRNPLDPYDHLVSQQQRGGVGLSPDGSMQQSQGSSMLAQQLGRPLNSVGNSQQIPVSSSSPAAIPQASPSQMAPTRHQPQGQLPPSHNVMTTQSEHQELPDSVTAELEKLEQEQHNDGGVEAETGELVDMGIDDDELLGMGADFNILEYADPELDQAVGGEKTNILDNLDLEEEKEEEKEESKDVRKKDHENRPGKREPNVSTYSSLGGQIQGSPSSSTMPKMETVPVQSNSGGIPSAKPNYLNQPGMNMPSGSNVGDMVSPMLRPPQPPPPPYVPPPPPYPGRPQMGIRNGGGLSMQSMPSMAGMGMGLKNPPPMGMMGNVGLRPSGHHVHPPPPLSSSCNPAMTIQQRRTLLLQEQPLLLEDLLEQEKREQQRQGPGLMGAAPEEPLLSDFEFERLKADVLGSSSLPVSLSPPNVAGQVILPPPSQPPGKFNRGMGSMNPTGGSDWQVDGNDVMGNRRNLNQQAVVEHSSIPLHPALAQAGSQNSAPVSRVPVFPTPSLPAPQTPPEHIVTEQDRQIQNRYEEWLRNQQQILSTQLQYYEPEVYKLRKGKKSLNSKQRQLRKNGGELNENDQMELERITKELQGLQKQLDQSRKQSRQHQLLMQDYNAKQAKRQLASGAQQSQHSPLGPASQSPLHSTPQSPILSPSPSMGAPVSSPMAQNSPMASPMTLSPGPSSLSQTSPRSVGPPLHHMDDRPFSPNNDGTMRSLASPQGGMQSRMVPQQQGGSVRMGSPGVGGQQVLMQQGGNQLLSGPGGMNQGMMMGRGGNPMHQQRPMVFMDNQRMRMGVPPEQLRMISPAGQRFARMPQELIMRGRGHQNQFQNQQMLMSPGVQQYSSPQRVPFPNQSPTGPASMGMVNSLRSPLPMNSLGLGSPPGSQVIMSQNRVSPASSPMRRPSGSGSVGVASPLPDRPQSVENPLTPRSTGSGPHTPSSIPNSSNMNCSSMDVLSGQQHPQDHFMQDTSQMQQDPNHSPHPMHGYGMYGGPPATPQPAQQTDYGGGGGGNSQVIPFPKFSWFDGPIKLGLKGGSPFSVVNGSPSSHSTNIIPDQGQVSLENSITDSIASANHANNSTGNQAIDSVQPSAQPSVLPGASNEHAVTTVDQAATVQVVKEVITESTVKPVAASAPATPVDTNSEVLPPTETVESQGVSEVTDPPNEQQVVDCGEPLQEVKLEPMEVADEVEPPNDTGEPIPELQIKTEPVELKPIPEIEGSTEIKKLVVVSSSGAPYIVTAVSRGMLPHSSSSLLPNATAVALSSGRAILNSVANSSVELPPSSIHQANVGVLGGFRPTKTQAVISQILEQNRIMPLQSIQSVDPSKVSNVTQMQGTPVSLASLVADAVNAATLPFPQATKSGSPGTFVNATVPLITVYSRPELKNMQGNQQHSNLVLLTSPRIAASTVSTMSNPQHSQQQQTQVQMTSKVGHPGESQNALLKQLLQNTGCASMNQAPTDTASLLTSLAKARPSTNVPVHASHLSEAASRIPQPTPPATRPTVATTAVSQTGGVRLPFKIEVRMSEAAGMRPIAPAPSTPLQPIVATAQQQSLQQQLTQQQSLQQQLTQQQQQVVKQQIIQQQSQIQISQQPVAAAAQLTQQLPAQVQQQQQPPTLPSQQMQILQQQQPPQIQQQQQQQQLPTQLQSQQIQNQQQQQVVHTQVQQKAQFVQQQSQQLSQVQQQMQAQATQPQQPTLLLSQLPQQVRTLPQQQPPPQITKQAQPQQQVAQVQQVLQQSTVQSGQQNVAIAQQVPSQQGTVVQQHQLQVKVIKLEDSIKAVNSEEVTTVDPPKDSSNSSIKDVIDFVAMDKNSMETTVTESKRSDEDVKKTKRRQYQSKKRPSIVKESSMPKKRLRKGSKPEEDYDSYMESMMTQIRGLPPVSIMEPELSQNYNVCPIFGAGDYSKMHTKCYNLVYGDLSGTFGNATVNNQDYYNEEPFGCASSCQSPKSQPSYRGFYHQEFGAPKLGNSAPKLLSEDRSPTPFRETDTPDTIVSASSPECVLDNWNMYPGLKLIDEDEEERAMHTRDSPVIPLFAPIPIRPVPMEAPKALKDDVDKENINVIPETFVFKARQTSGGSSPLKDNGNVTVTLTLSSNAAEDINGVLRNLANVLAITAPPMYQVVERTLTPPSQKLGLYTYKGKDGTEIVDIQSILNGSAKFCRQCDVVVLNNVIRKKLRDLPGIVPQDSMDESDDLYFCSTTCFMQYAMTHGVTLPTTEEKAGSVVKHPSEGVEGERLKLEAAGKLPLKDSRLTSYDHEIIKVKKKSSGKLGKESEKSLKRSVPAGEVRVKEEGEPPGKKWKGIKYKKWLPNHAQAQVKYRRPTEKEMTEMLFRMKITVSPPKMPDDSRRCMFCHQLGDGISDGPGRLLNYDVDKWVHLNCTLWSEEVYETESGALMNVEQALKQSFVLACVACKQKGATVKCFKTRCSSVYHLGCAVKEGSVFYKNKAVFCSAHIPKGEKENELTTLSVFRRVYVHRDENRQVATVMHHADQHNLLRVGSLIFLNVGQLLPHQLQNFHTSNFIYPVGYKIVRFYWSMKRTNKRCQYICSIHEVDGRPEFRIAPQEEGTQELVFKAASAQGAWHQVLDSISRLRNSSNTIKVFPKYITGEDLFGLTEPAIVRVLESLPGIETLTDYHFKYGRNPLFELPLAINPTGCARSEPKLRTHFKRPHTQRTGSSSRSASAMTTSSSVLSSSEAVCPYSKQFVHSKSSQYKKMKQDWRNMVYLARSKIQGLGLYAARDIEKHTMVIEYIGETIRSELAELREKKYEAQNRGIYMFRVDEDRVIDATLCGGLARYINHSCNPNCVAETVEVDRDWRIIIFANRRISRGEELAYDYKFEFEDDQHKIQCFCGAPNCRQWMN